MTDAEQPGFLSSVLLARHGFNGIFSLRGGGVSPPPYDSLNLGKGLGDADANVDINLARLIGFCGISTPHQAMQVHACDMLNCSGPGYFHQEQADALVSANGDTTLAVRTADCLPILIADPHHGTIAAVHAGWRGTAQAIAFRSVRRLAALGCRTGHLVAWLGPCIGPCCFHVGAETATLLAHSAMDAGHHVLDGGTRRVDLSAINRLQLLEAGVLPRNIEMATTCTCCDRKRFFSHRRDGASTGRHLAIIGMRKSPS